MTVKSYYRAHKPFSTLLSFSAQRTSKQRLIVVDKRQILRKYPRAGTVCAFLLNDFAQLSDSLHVSSFVKKQSMAVTLL